jgi:hypothetical protein
MGPGPGPRRAASRPGASQSRIDEVSKRDHRSRGEHAVEIVFRPAGGKGRHAQCDRKHEKAREEGCSPKDGHSSGGCHSAPEPRRFIAGTVMDVVPDQRGEHNRTQRCQLSARVGIRRRDLPTRRDKAVHGLEARTCLPVGRGSRSTPRGSQVRNFRPNAKTSLNQSRAMAPRLAITADTSALSTVMAPASAKAALVATRINA